MSIELINIIENELKFYKKYIAILAELEIDGVQAQRLSHMPRCVTNKFNSLTENMALLNQDKDVIKRSIARVQNWLDYLNWIERFVIKGFYIEQYTYTKIAREWDKAEGYYITKDHWQKIKKQSLKKIANNYQITKTTAK